ncbi:MULTISPECIES: MarR family winged helix-turn-helix transcriptional regulator [Stappiaceae]|jgi:DNA-binding MarR family transcriptional regulator|uniref:MarR family winged helix-turn-helix transcriptional regulator n=1 Tax=Stappiaceae TaxID=2821832 RepID=UPI001269574D|nr:MULTISPECIES: MarR family transcriptional regulator [Stappiaceae]MBN8184255.1 MarR family transcriptional regulator [Roseibium aggregatum]NKX64430.1 MarR family transcriptional regulator [Labrenzia sp. 5N]QFS97461.1 Transcriptional regulator SlyA [Labrenzia sp. THAF191b]QFT03776.1 Transcriptional regulator SlyA [Labrenzia sp. THAF191a]QFT15318.1 Transcriptional regulator SlyA [Labrenzia sp. THAF187b]
MGVPTPNVGVTMLVVDLARLLRRNFEAELSKVDTGLTAGEARTLFYVWRLPGQRQAVLADAMYVEPMTLVGYLDTLEKAGLIRRCQDPNDRRAKIIELTPLADPLLEKIGTALQEVRSRALEDIPADQRQILESLLQTMKDSLLQEVSKGKQK